MRLLVISCLAFALFGSSHAASLAATLSGNVVQRDGEPVLDAVVELFELRRRVDVDAAGRFAFENVPPGDYHLQAVSPSFGSAVAEVRVGDDGASGIELRLDLAVHREQLVVSATRTGRGSNEVVQPVEVLDRNDLDRKIAPTLGETLADERGVSSTFFGNGASRPVIRGLDAGRVRVLTGGLDVGDASTTSPDHAVADDGLLADGVEILRGPSALLYGSAAIGGVVNVLDRRIPEFRASKPLSGSVALLAGSVADETSVAARVEGGAGAWAWYADGQSRDADDYELADSGGVQDNSALESHGATVGVSYVGEDGFVGVSAKRFDSTYDVPVGEPLTIDMEQRRYDLRAGLRRDLGPFDGLRVAIGATDYGHVEFEDGDVGTRIFTDGHDARVELSHGSGQAWSGIVGVQSSRREFLAVGDEAYLPENDTTSHGLFTLQTLEAGPLHWEFGARLEANEVMLVDGSATSDVDAASGSVGVLWTIDDGWKLGGSATRAGRSPSAEELYSDGFHPATESYETGDPTLGRETSTSFDVNLRRTSGPVTGSLNVFHNRFDDFIYVAPTGNVIDGADEFAYLQGDADFVGAELEAVVALHHDVDHDLDLLVGADFVRAELRADDSALPRIPAHRYMLGVDFRGRRWFATAKATHTDEQDRVAAFETATDGYTFVDASVTYRLVASGVVHAFTLRGDNLTDRVGRLHVSRLKEIAPLPGRNVSLVYRVTF